MPNVIKRRTLIPTESAVALQPNFVCNAIFYVKARKFITKFGFDAIFMPKKPFKTVHATIETVRVLYFHKAVALLFFNSRRRAKVFGYLTNLAPLHLNALFEYTIEKLLQFQSFEWSGQLYETPALQSHSVVFTTRLCRNGNVSRVLDQTIGKSKFDLLRALLLSILRSFVHWSISRFSRDLTFAHFSLRKLRSPICMILTEKMYQTAALISIRLPCKLDVTVIQRTLSI